MITRTIGVRHTASLRIASSLLAATLLISCAGRTGEQRQLRVAPETLEKPSSGPSGACYWSLDEGPAECTLYQGGHGTHWEGEGNSRALMGSNHHGDKRLRCN